MAAPKYTAQPEVMAAVADDMDNKTAAAADFVALYRRAFAEFGTSALWSSRPAPNPSPDDALAITYSLRVEGNLEARRLSRLSKLAAPLSKIQTDILHLLASHRDPDSYVE